MQQKMVEALRSRACGIQDDKGKDSVTVTLVTSHTF